MPRDGSGIYHKPYPDVVTGTTIESTVHNGTVSDVELDLNTPRPIVAGGTGANNAHDAMVALSGEIATQGPVTNFDSFPFVNGSFYSNAGATAAPEATSAYVGTYYAHANPNYGYIEARNIFSPALVTFTRWKNGGVWQPWQQRAGSAADLDAAYVNVTGDTMTGALSLSPASGAPNINLYGAVGQNTDIYSYRGGVPRWLIRPGDAAPESGGNAGSNFAIYGFTDAGGIAGGVAAMTISRTDLTASFGGPIRAQSHVMSGTASATVGTYYFGNNGTKYLTYDGASFIFAGGGITVPDLVATNANGIRTTGGAITSSAHLMTQNGVVYFNNAGTAYINYGGVDFGFTGATNTNFTSNLLASGHIASALGYLGQAGVSGSRSGNRFNIEYVSSAHLWINGTDLGQIAFTSDYRIKKDVIDLPGMWDTVKALRPIKYTQAEFQPPSQADLIEKEKAEGREVNNEPMFKADNVERWGFIAHELQDTLVPSAATGHKDDHDSVQSPNPFTLIAALTKALQEAMTRIEALEAR